MLALFWACEVSFFYCMNCLFVFGLSIGPWIQQLCCVNEQLGLFKTMSAQAFERKSRHPMRRNLRYATFLVQNILKSLKHCLFDLQSVACQQSPCYEHDHCFLRFGSARQPDIGWTSRLSIPSLNSDARYSTVNKTVASTHNVATMSKWTTLVAKPFFCTYLITAPCKILFIFKKSRYKLLWKSRLSSQMSVYVERNNVVINIKSEK